MAIRFLIHFALLSVVLAAQIKLPLHKSENVREKMIREGRYKQWLAETGSQQASTGGLNLIDSQDTFYLMEINIGTPYQNVLVAIDTTSSDLWVLDAECTSPNCKGLTNPAKVLYNSSDSTSFVTGGCDFSLPVDNSTISGKLGKDRVTIAGITLSNQDFGDAKVTPSFYNMIPGTGVLGLGFPSRALSGTTPAIQNLLALLDIPVISIWLVRRNSVTDGNAGYIGFGMIEKSGCGDITYVPLANKSLWTFNVNAVTIGTYSRVKAEMGLSATGAGWTGVPPIVFSAIVKQTRAVYDSNYQIYNVNCSTVKDLPDLTIAIHGVPYVIKGVDYVEDLGFGQCILGFFQTDSNGSLAWILGDAFVRSYCHFFDYGNTRLGLALSNHKST